MSPKPLRCNPNDERRSLRYAAGMNQRVLIVGFVCTVVAAALFAQQARNPDAVSTQDSLLLKNDQVSVSLAAADFRTLQHISITVHNGHAGRDETYSGVPLATLLVRINAPMGNALRGKAMTTYVTATGSDGYAVVLSLAEVDPDFHENQIIVAEARDGQALGKNGPFQLIVPGDKRPARWVHNLVSIALERAQ
jgi:hypothetical protein